MVGIVSYGTYIPAYRIRVADIARAWKKEPSEVTGALGVAEKSVPGIDEDAVTIALEAALKIFEDKNFQRKRADIEALFRSSLVFVGRNEWRIYQDAVQEDTETSG